MQPCVLLSFCSPTPSLISVTVTEASSGDTRGLCAYIIAQAHFAGHKLAVWLVSTSYKQCFGATACFSGVWLFAKASHHLLSLPLSRWHSLMPFQKGLVEDELINMKQKYNCIINLSQLYSKIQHPTWYIRHSSQNYQIKPKIKPKNKSYLLQCIIIRAMGTEKKPSFPLRL